MLRKVRYLVNNLVFFLFIFNYIYVYASVYGYAPVIVRAQEAQRCPIFLQEQYMLLMTEPSF